MRQKVSDYIADFIVEHGIRDLFTVPGGLAMHMNDSFGHKEGLRVTYQHHEQACAMAAEAYARMGTGMAAVCVTAGPAAVNALSGALGCYMDSLPVIIFSGQTRIPTMVKAVGLPVRSRGTQECDIVSMVTPITKYAVTVESPLRIRYHLEKAFYLARAGRPGPSWLDVPLDVQGAVVETDELVGYDTAEDSEAAARKIPESAVTKTLDMIERSVRPTIFPGNGIRIAGAHDEFMELVDLLGIPVTDGVSSVDAMPEDHPLFAGRSGSTGTRAGNFVLQNSDLLLSIGCRQSYMQTGFNTDAWARCAYKILCDIDVNEVMKPDLKADLPVVGDAKDFIEALIRGARERGATRENPLFKGDAWREQCLAWKYKYPAVTEKHFETAEAGRSNIYAFYSVLSDLLPEEQIICVSVGTSRVVGSQIFRIKKGQRFITNPNTAAMGFDLPAVIGAARATDRPVVAVTGEGSLMMNLQEFQTLKHNKIPFKLFVVNNEGYHSVRQTQQGFFNTSLVGVGTESGDLSFPDLSALVPAFGFTYTEVRDSSLLREKMSEFLSSDGSGVCQIFVTKKQKTEPKLSSRKLPDGSMVSASLEDMFPFLDREEFAENMFIPEYKGPES